MEKQKQCFLCAAAWGEPVLSYTCLCLPTVYHKQGQKQRHSSHRKQKEPIRMSNYLILCLLSLLLSDKPQYCHIIIYYCHLSHYQTDKGRTLCSHSARQDFLGQVWRPWRKHPNHLCNKLLLMFATVKYTVILYGVLYVESENHVLYAICNSSE